jgi:ATP adenylyltransferase
LSAPTQTAFIEDGGVRFLVRLLSGLRRKDDARKEQASASRTGAQTNPFLPPEKDLLVGDISETHVAILNKFNVVENHLLLVTRGFEDQETLLTLGDFEALWFCMAEYDALAFYNGGSEAGASQRHKHLQLVPLPLAPEGAPVPMSVLFSAAPDDGICTLPGLPFLHAFVRLHADPEASAHALARAAFELYGGLLQSVGMESPHSLRLIRQSMPYCLVVTRGFMLLVPRSREHFEDISFNSLAFVGSLFLRNEQQLERLRAYGPMNALRSVALPLVRS